MSIFLNGAYKLLFFLPFPDLWLPYELMLYCILIIGAFLTAGVALSILSFCEDHYLGDKEFRDQMKVNLSLRDN
tara:strand:+ start:265 stop:486 length:222 start_codon:yes stop_codon:yes gene_type:complete